MPKTATLPVRAAAPPGTADSIGRVLVSADSLEAYIGSVEHV